PRPRQASPRRPRRRRPPLSNSPRPATASGKAPVKLLTNVEKLQLLAKAERPGLLSAVERAELSLSAVERLGLLSKVEELGALSAATDPGTPGALLSLALPLLAAGAAVVYLVPEEHACSLFFNPLKRGIYDYMSGLSDLRKNKARLMTEMNYMLSYGPAEYTFLLLRKYGLLDILLSFQASTIGISQCIDQFSTRCPSNQGFAAVLHFGSWESIMNFLEQDIGCHAPFVPETLGTSQTKLDNLMEQTIHLASLVNSSICTLTSLDALQQSVARYRDASQFSPDC
ncbi:hypothetical protein BAE44_0009715, partial [Dichanthelium oligosanthes]